MVSALTLLQAEDLQTARERWSYLLLADEVRRASASPERDLHELFARMCFNAAISNLDDHPRNHALLAKERSEEHTSELQSLMRISYAVFCLKKKTSNNKVDTYNTTSNNKTVTN